MSRTMVVTGAASGIGKTTAELLRINGDTVIGVDLAGSDISVDLTTAEGRAALVEEVSRISGGTIDGILAIAGLAAPIPGPSSVAGRIRVAPRGRSRINGEPASP
jgi:NAD(P)-dependent dehydrogenase (short-subunit alcohol dehydrogenase family)